MKTSINKRLLSFFLAVVMVLGLVPYVATPEAEAATPDYAALKSTIQGYQYPIAETLNWPAGNNSLVDGIYLILSSQPRDGTICYNLNPGVPETDGKGYVGYAVTKAEQVSDLTMIGANRDSYSIIKGTPSSFSIQTMGGLYWNFETITNESTYGALRLRGEENNNRFKIGISSGRYHSIQHVSKNWYMHSNSWTFRASIAWQPQKTADENYFWIAKVNEEAFYLRDALQDAIPYLIDNSSGFYDAVAYEEFLQTVKGASDYYASIKRTVWSAIDSNVAKNHKNALYNAAGKLKLTDPSLEYIDIHIEVLDFRGDGFLFESENVWESPYSLSKDSAGQDLATGALGKFPGIMKSYTASGDDFRTTGLVQSELIDGKIVYTKETVDYIAYHLAMQNSYIKTPTDKMNSFIHKLVTSHTLSYDSNGYSATIDKCEPKKPGGELHWGQIKTYHDLAYYLLSHMWSSTSDAMGQDTYANGAAANVTYNMVVPELAKLRLFKENGT